MEAKDLMIGDWVVYNGDVDYINPIKIEGMDIATGMCVTTDRDDVGFDGVWPIPLTAEILEKNFLVQRGEWTEPILYFFSNDYIEISIKEYTDGIWEVVVDEVEMSGLPSWRMYVSDVHKLQHVLRLVGTEKEIEL